MLAVHTVFNVEYAALSSDAVYDVQSDAIAFFEQQWDGHVGDLVVKQDGVALSDEAVRQSRQIEDARTLLFDEVAASSRLRTRIVNTLGPGAGLVYDCSSIRRQRPAGTPLPWHQDAVPMDTTDPAEGMVLWIPLVRIDATTPSLEFYNYKKPIMQHIGNAAGFAQAVAGPADIIDARHIIQCPDLDLGDVVIFGLDVVHRTLVTHQNIRSRYSCDMRVGSAAWIERHPQFEVLRL